jgi:hypothetical protein
LIFRQLKRNLGILPLDIGVVIGDLLRLLGLRSLRCRLRFKGRRLRLSSRHAAHGTGHRSY